MIGIWLLALLELGEQTGKKVPLTAESQSLQVSCFDIAMVGPFFFLEDLMPCAVHTATLRLKSWGSDIKRDS